jgi:EmrB/QacA subfamily drug resistance transporter
MPRALSPRGLALIVASAMFMEQLDGTIVATALPAMARSFAVPPAFMSIAMTAYLISLAVFIPASGQLADRLGARRVFAAAILVFTFASLACALAPTLPMFIAARVVQGVGGAMMVPVGRLILLRTVDKSERIAAMAWLLVPAMVGPVVGPPLGGLIVTLADWQWIFYINLPIGVLGLALVARYIPETARHAAHRFDLRGLVLSGIALCAVTGAFEIAARNPHNWPPALAALLLGAAAGALYIGHARRHPDPVLDLRLLRHPSFLAAITAGTLFRIGFGALPFLLPLMLQLGFHLSALQSGLITFASAASSMAMKAVTVKILRRFGFRSTLIWNGLACTVFLAICAAFRPAWPLVSLYAVLFIGGAFRSLQFNAYGSIAYADISQARMSAATSLYSTVHQLSLSFGVAIAAAILALALAAAHHPANPLPAYSIAFLCISAISLPAVLICTRLPATAGDELTMPRAKTP